MRKMSLGKVAGLVLLLAVSGTSCKFDRDDFDFGKVGIRGYEASWVANLLDAEVTIGDFVSDSIVSGVSLITSPDDRHFFISYQLDYHTDTLDVRKWVKVDTLSGKEVKYIDNPDYPKESYTDIEACLKFDFAKVDTISLKSGLVEFWITTPLDTSKISAEFQSNVLLEKRNGLLFSYVQKLHFGKNTIDLKDKFLIINDSNIVRGKVIYKAEPFTGEYADSSSAPLYIDYNLRLPEFHYITGEIYKDTSIELANGKIFYTLLPEKMDMQLRVNNVSLMTDVVTNVGFPMECDVDRLKFYNNLNGKNYDFLSTEKYTLKVNMPKSRGMTSRTLDTLKINKDAVLSNDGYMDFVAYAKLKKGRFFIDENARYDANAHLEFPLDMTVEQFRYRDTFSFSSLSGIDSTLEDNRWDYVKSMLLRYEFINGIPLDLAVQVFFTDSNYTVLDSLFESRNVLKGAQVDPYTAMVTDKTRSGAQYITFDKERVSHLAKTRFLLLEAAATTTQSQRAVLSADQTLRMRMGAKVNLKVNYRKK